MLGIQYPVWYVVVVLLLFFFPIRGHPARRNAKVDPGRRHTHQWPSATSCMPLIICAICYLCQLQVPEPMPAQEVEVNQQNAGLGQLETLTVLGILDDGGWVLGFSLSQNQSIIQPEHYTDLDKEDSGEQESIDEDPSKS